MKRSFKVTLDIPDGVTVQECQDYILEDVSAWRGQTRPPVMKCRWPTVTVNHRTGERTYDPPRSTEDETIMTDPDIEAEATIKVKALIVAMEQLLEDMGLHSQSVSLTTKAQARIAYEPFRDRDEDASWLMDLDEAISIVNFR